MILYVNGDSHSAAAEAAVTHCFAEDDPQLWYMGRRPHPLNEAVSYGIRLAEIFKARPIIAAESASSNNRILRTTREFLKTNSLTESVFVLIGWSNWEREEWLHNDQYLQVTASGTDSVPEELRVDYMNWVVQQEHRFVAKEQYWHQQIVDFHKELQSNNIPHFFFNSYHKYTNIPSDQWIDWQGCYYRPYEADGSYHNWCYNQGYKTVSSDSFHFGKDAHAGWANHLVPHLTSLL